MFLNLTHARRGLPLVALAMLAAGTSVLASQTRPATAPSPHQLGFEASKGPGGNLAAVVALEKAESSFAANRDQWLDVLATQLIFVGDHRKALEYNSKAYTEARLVVWSGRHHMSEDEADEGAGGEAWTPMGGIFREISGIDPLTVDLMVMNEQATPDGEHKTYRWAIDKGPVTEAVVFMNAEGKAWTPIDSLDAAVVFPRTQWTRGRPDWLRMGGVRVPAKVDWSATIEVKPAPDRPLVIEARLLGEEDKAVPLDRVIWREGDAPPLFVRPGKGYKFQLRDPDGKVLSELSVKMNPGLKRGGASER